MPCGTKSKKGRGKKRVLDERMRFEKQYMETVTELNDLKKQGENNLLNKLVHFLHNLLRGK